LVKFFLSLFSDADALGLLPLSGADLVLKKGRFPFSLSREKESPFFFLYLPFDDVEIRASLLVFLIAGCRTPSFSPFKKDPRY